MLLSSSLVLSLLALVTCHTAQAHGTGKLQIFGTNIVADLGRRDLASSHAIPTPFELETRQAENGLCGKQAGGASCAPGFCCSADGQCGKGNAFCDAPTCQFEYGPACDTNATPSGSNTSTVPRPHLGKVSYTPAGIWNCTVPGTVALTYDDGPYIYTSDLLDVLKAHDAPVTFFITGNNYGKHGIDNTSTPYPDIITRMHADGHQIASHTWSHEDLDQITHYERMDQMVKNEMAMRNILGFFPTYMRPPFDSCTEATGCRGDISNLGYHIIEYNIATYDYINLTPDTIQLSKDNVTTGFAGGLPSTSDYIVYSHDTHPQTVYNLTAFMLSTIKTLGYKPVTIGQCLGDPAENWYRNASTGEAVTASPYFPSSFLSSSSAGPFRSASASSSLTAPSPTLAQATSSGSSTTAQSAKPSSKTSSALAVRFSGGFKNTSMSLFVAVLFWMLNRG